MVRVGNNCTIRVNKMVYLVPCRLIGVKKAGEKVGEKAPKSEAG